MGSPYLFCMVLRLMYSKPSQVGFCVSFLMRSVIASGILKTMLMLALQTAAAMDSAFLSMSRRVDEHVVPHTID